MPEQRPHRRAPVAVCALLILAVAAVFGQSWGFGFVNYDDDVYVYDNPHVARGITSEGLVWAFSGIHGGNWHPATTLSHMLDCQFYGLRPGPQHLTNVALHACAAVLAFLALWRLTGRLWPSACVAAVFAVHPLRAESVAWISQRKDVLSGLFFWLTLWLYADYARRPFSFLRWLAVLASFAAGLLAKPMLVTLPFVLLLLDYWPLGRLQPLSPSRERGRGEGVMGFSDRFFEPTTLRRRLIEKLPLFALSVVGCRITLWAQREAFLPPDAVPFAWRIGNALVAAAGYVGQLFWPVQLAVLYPHPGRTLLIGLAIASGALLAAITLGAWWTRRKRPYLLVGWCWFLGMLVPVSGLVQVGSQASADRYTYLPHVGLVIALAWLAADVLRNHVRLAAVAALAVVLSLAVAAWRQTGCWRDSVTLFSQALAHAAPHPAIYNNLSNALADAGRPDEAAAFCQKALELDPLDPIACDNMGNLLAAQGRSDEAIAWYRRALAITPQSADTLSNLGNILATTDRLAEAADCYRASLRANPYSAEAHGNLGNVLAAQGQLDEAIASQRRALELKPELAETHYNLGNALYRQGQTAEALAHFHEALALAERQVKTAAAESIRSRLRNLPSPALP